MHIILHACTHIFKHFSIAVSTLLSFKRLRANRREEKQEGNVSSCTFFMAGKTSAGGTAQAGSRNLTKTQLHAHTTQTAYKRHVNEPRQQNHRGCRQPNIPETARCIPAAMNGKSFRASWIRVYVCACMSLCAVQGQLYLSSSSSVLLMETALFAVDGYRMLSTHTLGTKPSSDECSNIAVTPNASMQYTRTRSLCFQLCRVYAGPFSSI